MKLHLQQAAGRNLVTGYGTDHVRINGERHTRSLVVLPDALHPWPPARVEDLDAHNLGLLDALPGEILLLGTGRRLHFPAPALRAMLCARGRGLEVMDTGAACRTYNILLAEGRAVICALLIEAPQA